MIIEFDKEKLINSEIAKETLENIFDTLNALNYVEHTCIQEIKTILLSAGFSKLTEQPE